ncbi:TetR/AcrR family transcriptional regulator [Lentzea albidocapillata]|uniref:Transcriptional regulator, TetR family n=1 Tax=Lentzea albidocapillata TaxID=40571 RepID=A0A1W2EGD1_9PSEU|nr:TetR family transcriptional regulator [Lentzea albidocapillata]SMD08168.1 transcriptional regulator, TetR family [Lentzea albidocapillata]
MELQKVDGRKARGEKKRRTIVEATLRVIERDGVAGVTHRSVAREAGVPTTAPTYYFATLDDLLIATLLWSAEELCDDMLKIVASGGCARDIAQSLAKAVNENRSRTLAEYELYLLAGRRPELKPAARRWLDLAVEAVRPADPVAFRAFLAAVDGLLMQGLIADVAPNEDELEPIVSFLIRGCDDFTAAPREE